MTDFESVLKNAKTFLELQIAYRKIFDQEPILEADKIGRIASLNIFNNSKWVSMVEIEKLKTTLQQFYQSFPKTPKIKGILPKDWEDWFIALAIWKQELEKKLGCVETENHE